MLKFFPTSFADQLTPRASASSSHQAEPNPFDASLGAGAQAPAAGQQSSTQGAPPSRHHLLLQTHSYLQPPPANTAGDLTPLGQSISLSSAPRAHSLLIARRPAIPICGQHAPVWLLSPDHPPLAECTRLQHAAPPGKISGRKETIPAVRQIRGLFLRCLLKLHPLRLGPSIHF